MYCSNSIKNRPLYQMQSVQNCVNKQVLSIVLIASGALVFLAAIFLTLAAHQALPQINNSISALGQGGKILSYCLMTVGISGIISGVLLIVFRAAPDEVHQSVPTSSLSQDMKKNDTKLIKKNITQSINLADSREVIPQKKESKTNLEFNRLPCAHEGNSCFVNTTLQILAHLFPHLFDKQHYKLEKDQNETKDAFQKRQIVQDKGKQIINGILTGQQIRGLNDFIQSLNEALIHKCDSSFDIYYSKGGDAYELLPTILNILFGSRLKDKAIYIKNFSTFNILNLYETKQELKKMEKAPQVLAFHNLFFDTYGGVPYLPEIDLQGIGLYRLEAIMFSSGKLNSVANSNAPAVGGHAIPIIRAENGQFMIIDDMADRAHKITQGALTEILKGKGWQMVYYVNVSSVCKVYS